MIVDTHVHVIAEDQRQYPRTPAAANTEWVRDLTAESLLALMEEAGIGRTILVQAHGAYQYNNNYAADCARKYSGSFASVCIVDALEKDAADQLSYWVNERGVRGLRLFDLGRRRSWLDQPATFSLWERARSLGIPVCVCTRWRNLPLLHAPLVRFPEIPFALDHLGLPRLDRGAPYEAVMPLFEMARFPNVYLKFSTVSIDEASRGKSSPKDFFQRLLERFGPQRMMWGSNYPATYDRSLQQQLELAREELSFISTEDQRWLFSETALTLWPELR
ncbi:MAG: amidohydrolase family protein [Candidatus Binataceae bacterium]